MAGAPETQAIIDRDFPSDTHPYPISDRAILSHIDAGDTVLDIGCGSRATNLMQLKDRAKTLVGIDLVDFEVTDSELLLVNADVCDMSAVRSGSVDLSYSRSVMEHVKNVRAVYSEINRVLKPGVISDPCELSTSSITPCPCRAAILIARSRFCESKGPWDGTRCS